MDKMQEFFKALSEEQEDVLSDMELNMVAGGKSGTGIASICLSIVSLGYGCFAVSILAAESLAGKCKTAFE